MTQTADQREAIRVLAVEIRDKIHRATWLSAYGALCETIKIIKRRYASLTALERDGAPTRWRDALQAIVDFKSVAGASDGWMMRQIAERALIADQQAEAVSSSGQWAPPSYECGISSTWQAPK